MIMTVRLNVVVMGLNNKGQHGEADIVSDAIDVILSQRVSIDALKTKSSKGDEEIKKLSPLVEIVSNQKQRIQQLEEALIIADKWLDIDAQYYGSPVCNKIKKALPKFKDAKL